MQKNAMIVSMLYIALLKKTLRISYQKNNNPVLRREEFKKDLQEVVKALEKEVETKQLSIYDYKDGANDKYQALSILKKVQARFNTFDSYIEKENNRML